MNAMEITNRSSNNTESGDIVPDAADATSGTTHQVDPNQCIDVDLDRNVRCGFPEVIYGEGKTVPQIAAIADTLLNKSQDVFATRIPLEVAEQVCEHVSRPLDSSYNEVARTLTFFCQRRIASKKHRFGYVPIVAAGTTDLPVAEEARETLRWMNINTKQIIDVGVAGPHRLPERLADLKNADAIVVVAGMEGALPSIVGGYVDCPIIAVPTSVGYGASLGGVAALLSMLNSCASNVTVVNIDAGFKAAYVAGIIATKIDTAKQDDTGKLT